MNEPLIGLTEPQAGQIGIAVAGKLKDRFHAHLVRNGIPCTSPTPETSNHPELNWIIYAACDQAKVMEMVGLFAKQNT